MANEILIQSYKQLFSALTANGQTGYSTTMILIPIVKQIEENLIEYENYNLYKYKIEESIEEAKKHFKKLDASSQILHQFLNPSDLKQENSLIAQNSEQQILLDLVSAFAQSPLIKKKKNEIYKFKQQLDFLKKCLNCIRDYGLLISEIEKREKEFYNVLIRRANEGKRNTNLIALFLEKDDFEKNYLSPFKNKQQIFIEGESIAFSIIDKIKISKTKISKPEKEAYCNKNRINGEIEFINFCEDITHKNITSADFLNQININKEVKNMEKSKIKIFVTYRWESEEHNEKVISFTNYLRRNGYAAVNDEYLSQEETAIDFSQMMHQGLTDNDKVIIVLSEAYAERANKFQGGVGTEYSMIIKDIKEKKNKYILVSFNGIRESIFPLFLKGKNCLDLEGLKDKDKLFAKLNDEPLTEFAEVASAKPKIEPKPIPNFEDLMTISNKIINHSKLTNTDKVLFDKIRNELMPYEKVKAIDDLLQYVKEDDPDAELKFQELAKIFDNNPNLEEFVKLFNNPNFEFVNKDLENSSIKFINSIVIFRKRVSGIYYEQENEDTTNQVVENVTSSYKSFIRKGRELLE